MTETRCYSVGRVTAGFLLSFLVASSTIPIASSWGTNGYHQVPLVPLDHTVVQRHEESIKPSQDHEFVLRHIFHQGTHSDPYPHRWLDILPDDDVWVMVEGPNVRPMEGPLRARSRQTTIQRLSDRRVATIKSLIGTGLSATLAPSAWRLDELNGPDIRDKETVLNLATMASNSYVKVPKTEDWRDLGGRFNESSPFGWEGDGLRGHIFADQGNSTIVIAIKGTTPALFDGAETTSNDKENDNLFFGCCCGAGGHLLWRRVCECSTSAFTCEQTCVVKALRMENRYYQAALHLYENVTGIYPDSQIWMTGHSLGGAVSSLLGLTFGIPATSFEAPGEALAAARLGLPSPPDSHPNAPQSRKNTGVYHFGHTADPVFMGTCNAAMSACTLGGYAMESECHTGNICVYDTVKEKGWRVGIGYHKIHAVVDDVIKAYDEVAQCAPDSECVDCFNWKFFESNETSPSTSSSATSTLTRTTTCHTPGWWGCLDSDEPTSTSRSSAFKSTSTHTTTTCHTPGWFGCLDPNDPTTTSMSCQTSTSLTCSHYGWFGACLDTTTSPATSVTYKKHGSLGACLETTTSSTTSVTCKKHGWFGCLDNAKSHATGATCHRYGWFGRCLERGASFRTSTVAVEALTTAAVASTRSSLSNFMIPSPVSYPIATTATPTQPP